MNRRLRRLGVAGMAFTCLTLPLTGCEAWDNMSRELKGAFSGAGAGIATALIASAAGMDTQEAILLGLAAGVAVGLVVYAVSERPATPQEQAVIARQSEELRTQTDPELAQALEEQQILVARRVDQPPQGPAGATPPSSGDTIPVQMYEPNGTPVGDVVELPREQVEQAQQAQAQSAAAGETRVTEIETTGGTYRVLITS